MLPYNDQFSFDGVPFSPSNFLINNPDSPRGEQVVPQNAGEPHFADTAFYRNPQNGGPDASPEDGCFMADSSCMSFSDVIVSPRDGSLMTVGSSADFGNPFARCIPESSSSNQESLHLPSSSGQSPASSGQEFNSPSPTLPEFNAASFLAHFNIPTSTDEEFLNASTSTGQQFNSSVSSSEGFFNVPASSGQEFLNVPASSGQEFLNVPYSNSNCHYFSIDQPSTSAVDSSNLSFAVPSCSQMSVASSSSQKCSVTPYANGQCPMTSSSNPKPVVSSSNQWFVASSNSRRSPVSSPSSYQSSTSSPSSQGTSIDCTAENLWDIDFDYSKMSMNELESLNLDVFDNVNDSDPPDDHNDYTTHSIQSPSKNYPFIGKESNDVTLTELNLIDFPTKTSMKASVDLEDEIKGQIFLPMTTHNRFLDPMVKKGRELYRMPASSYTPDSDHCYYSKQEPEEWTVEHEYKAIKIKEEPKEITMEESEEPKIMDRSLRLRIKREPKVEIKEESMDEDSDSESSSDSSDGDYVDVRPSIPRRPIRAAAMGTVSESEYRAQCHTRKRADRPIVKPKRFSQRENTPPVRQYKRTCNKKETTMVTAALLKQMKPNQRNTKTPAKRGRKPANSLNSSVNSSRAGSEVEEANPKKEPNPKRAEHNTLERNRRNMQRNYLHDMRDAMPHFRHDLKASKVKIIFAASAYIKVIEDEHYQLATRLHQLQKQNAFLKRRRDFLLNC